MATLYSKEGKEVQVPHPIDVKGWLEIGYLKEKPKKRTPRKKVEK